MQIETGVAENWIVVANFTERIVQDGWNYLGKFIRTAGTILIDLFGWLQLSWLIYSDDWNHFDRFNGTAGTILVNLFGWLEPF